MKTVLFFSFLLLSSYLTVAQSISLEPVNPNNPSKGAMVFDKNTNQLKYWNGSVWIPMINGAAGTGWAVNGTHIYNANTGNVGIGTTTPKAPLNVGLTRTVLFGADTAGLGAKFMWISVRSALRAGMVNSQTAPWDFNKIGHSSIGLGVNTLASGVASVALGGAAEATGSYAVAIGTQTKATASFSTAMGYQTTASANYSTAMGYKTTANGNYSTALGYETHTNNQYATAIGYNNADVVDGLFMVGDGFTINGGHNALLVLKNGNVGIGGLNSPDAPLHVGQGLNGQLNLKTNKYFNHATDEYIHNLANNNYYVSILANNNIVTEGAFVSSQTVTSSDARIKNVIGLSEAAKDLELLRKIKVTDYTYKDEVTMGKQAFKKVIAQEVEAVYPEAVKQISSIIPDIYSLAENAEYDADSKSLTLTMAKDYQLKPGEKIKLVHPAYGEVTTTIETVIGKKFIVKDWQYASDKVFVYGREVKDFRTVDYEALSMLGISAIQQLAKEVEELKKQTSEMEELKKQNKALKVDFTARLEALESRLLK